MTDRPGRAVAGWYAAAAIGAAGFIVYGSLVPFAFAPKPWAEAVEAFRWAMAERVGAMSRSDWLANVMLGVPLGFFLLGAVRANRANRASGFRSTMSAAVLLWPLCVGLACAVEFGQLFVPGRTCAGSDVIAQGLGAAVGMIGWAEFGPKLTARTSDWLAGSDGRTAVVGAAIVYLGLLALILYMPFDLTLSPYDLGRKLVKQVEYAPFSGFAGVGTAAGRGQLQHRAELAAVYLPAGLLAARLRMRSPRQHGYDCVALPILILLPIVMEAGQLFVESHVPQAGGAVVGMVGVSIGWCLGRAFGSGLAWPMSGAILAVWCVFLAGVMWQPFDFSTAGSGHGVWLPLAEVVWQDYLLSAEQWLTRMMLYVPVGIVVAAAGSAMPSGRRIIGAGLVGAGIAVVVEVGQSFLPTRTPAATDVILGTIGAAVGAVFARRLRTGPHCQSTVTRGAG